MSLSKTPDSSGLIARQPITDAKGSIVAYELLNRSRGPNQHDTGSDIFLLFNALNHAGNELAMGETLTFINRTHQSLADVPLEMVRPEKIVLEIDPVPGHQAQGIEKLLPTLKTLKAQGYKIAFDHTVIAPVYAAWQPLADYIKMDVLAIKPVQLERLMNAAKTRTTARIIAEKIESQAQFDAMTAFGATLFQGYWVGRPDVVKTRIFAPQAAGVAELFNLVRKQAETAQIEAVLKRDPILGFKLLQVINSAGFGLGKHVTSFSQAVMLMGMKKLFRWTALLLTVARDNQLPAVLGTTAVVRGRMMELLGAGTLTPEQSDNAFVVGFFSLLDEMMGVPMAQALGLLDLPDDVIQALLQRQGVLGQMLALTIACESDDDTSFSAAAAALGYSTHHINIAHMESLVWADSPSSSVGARV
jgi:c-di-GMP-related signal transduction protein